ncbi:MAG TPA: magnesium/cobalt transporter CorA [Cryptosporangiaceae bacterium]|nr:magnesium/cobalt transporter CorA [Cryptosporangiaceae bacterium]
MADGNAGSDRIRARDMARALSAPVRAVGRVLPRGPGPSQVGEPPRNTTGVIDCGLYVDGVRRPGQWDYADALREARRHESAFVWLGVFEPEQEQLSDVAGTFGLHELAVEDAVKAFQRPKLERYDDTTFVVLKTARYVAHRELTATSEVVETGDVMVFIGDRFVITVRHGAACRLGGVRAELEQRPEMLCQGPWAVFHAVTDQVVDQYIDVVEAIEDDIDSVEVEVFGRASADVQRLYQLKRELVELKRAVLPLARPLDSLTSGAVPGVPDEIRRYIRDVADHHNRVTDQIATFDDLLNSILQANLAQVGIRQNNDMRKISAWVAIAAVPTAVAGIYGMNFDYMPELRWQFGYPMVLAVILGVCALLYRQFKRTGWL